VFLIVSLMAAAWTVEEFASFVSACSYLSLSFVCIDGTQGRICLNVCSKGEKSFIDLFRAFSVSCLCNVAVRDTFTFSKSLLWV